MNPRYDDQASGFDQTTLGLLRVSLPHHLDSTPKRDTYRAVLDYYKAHPEGWVVSERDGLIARLSAEAARNSSPPAAQSAAPSPRPSASTTTPPAPELTPASRLGLDTLSKEARAAYDRALQAEAHGELRVAWRLIIPVVETNPRVFEVQELRCRLAQKQRFIEMIVEAHCAPQAALRPK